MLPLLALFACAPVADNDPADPFDTAAPRDGWILGDPTTCDAGTRVAHTDVSAAWSETYTDLPPEAPSAINPGAIALLGEPGTWTLAWVEPSGLALRPLDGGAITRLPMGTAQSLVRADLDDDGRDDLLIAMGGLAVLWGAGSSGDVRMDAMEELVTRRTNARPADVAAGDLDDDGDTDLFVAWTSPDRSLGDGIAASVLRNEGGRGFTEVRVDAPASTWGAGFDVTLQDIDADGALDAYVCQDSGPTDAPSVLLRNLGDLRFVPVPGIGLDTHMYCMGASWGDVDNDSALEVYLAGAEHHALHKEAGNGTWADIAASNGLAAPFPGGVMAWGSALSDVDNDGEIDLLVGTGDFWTASAARNDAWHYRREDDHFTRDEDALPLPTATSTRGVLTYDLNDDGVLDVVFGDTLRTPWVLRSEGCTADAWLEVEAPVGAEVRVEANGVSRAALVTGEPGWGATRPAITHIGLGDVDTVDRLTLRLPGGDEVNLDGPFAPRRRIAYAP
jgi:hypothetical protein